jgi:hypothetical protein
MPPRIPTQESKIACGLAWLRSTDGECLVRSNGHFHGQLIDTKTQAIRAQITVALTAMPPPSSNQGF